MQILVYLGVLCLKDIFTAEKLQHATFEKREEGETVTSEPIRGQVSIDPIKLESFEKAKNLIIMNDADHFSNCGTVTSMWSTFERLCISNLCQSYISLVEILHFQNEKKSQPTDKNIDYFSDLI